MKFPGDIWTVEIWTVKTRLGLRLGLGFLLWLGLVMTVQFMTVQILTAQIETNGWMDEAGLGMVVGLSPGDLC